MRMTLRINKIISTLGLVLFSYSASASYQSDNYGSDAQKEHKHSYDQYKVEKKFKSDISIKQLTKHEIKEAKHINIDLKFPNNNGSDLPLASSSVANKNKALSSNYKTTYQSSGQETMYQNSRGQEAGGNGNIFVILGFGIESSEKLMDAINKPNEFESLKKPINYSTFTFDWDHSSGVKMTDAQAYNILAKNLEFTSDQKNIISSELKKLHSDFKDMQTYRDQNREFYQLSLGFPDNPPCLQEDMTKSEVNLLDAKHKLESYVRFNHNLRTLYQYVIAKKNGDTFTEAKDITKELGLNNPDIEKIINDEINWSDKIQNVASSKEGIKNAKNAEEAQKETEKAAKSSNDESEEAKEKGEAEYNKKLKELGKYEEKLKTAESITILGYQTNFVNLRIGGAYNFSTNSAIEPFILANFIVSRQSVDVDYADIHSITGRKSSNSLTDVGVGAGVGLSLKMDKVKLSSMIIVDSLWNTSSDTDLTPKNSNQFKGTAILTIDYLYEGGFAGIGLGAEISSTREFKFINDSQLEIKPKIGVFVAVSTGFSF